MRIDVENYEEILFTGGIGMCAGCLRMLWHGSEADSTCVNEAGKLLERKCMHGKLTMAESVTLLAEQGTYAQNLMTVVRM